MSDIQLREYTARIGDLIAGGRQDEAIAHCRYILLFHPRHGQTYRLLGEACLAKEMCGEARDFFQRALSADPEDVGTWLGLGRAYGEHGMPAEALWAVENAFELEPGHGKVRQDLGRLYGQRDRDPSVGVQAPGERTRLRLTRGALGRLYMRCNLYDKAIDELQAALLIDSSRPVTHVALAEALWRDGRDLEATNVCLEILRTLPNCLKVNLILGTIWLRSGNPRPAQARLDVARALDPENLMAQEMMGHESPLPAAEVLVAVPKDDKSASAPTLATSDAQAVTEDVPIWVRELEQLEVRATTPTTGGVTQGTSLAETG